MDKISLPTVMFLIMAIFYILIIYVVVNYDKRKFQKNIYDIDKYIKDNFPEHFCTILINGGGKFKLEDNWLICYNSFGKERIRVICVPNENKSYFRYILKDSMDEIESQIKTDISAM